MQQNSVKPIGLLIVALLLTVFAGVSLAEEVSLTCVVTEEGLLEAADGRIMEVADTEMGAELLDNTGKKVQVTGEITDEEDTITIRVTDFSVIEE